MSSRSRAFRLYRNALAFLILLFQFSKLAEFVAYTTTSYRGLSHVKPFVTGLGCVARHDEDNISVLKLSTERN